MNKKIKNNIKKKMLRLCEQEHKTKIWQNHLTKTVYYSKVLAKKLNKDEEICEIAAWIHDVAKMQGQKKDHHIKGAKDAKKILEKEGYDTKKIKKIQAMIKTHSSDEKYPPKTTEEKILASADALAWLEDFLLFVNGLKNKKLTNKEIKKILKEKIKVAKNKTNLLEEAKEIAKPRISAIEYMIKNIK